MVSENDDIHLDDVHEDDRSIQSSNTDQLPLCKVAVTGEYVYLGQKKFRVEELQTAFGGTLNSGLMPYKQTVINPAPLGLSAFALTTFVLSLYNIRVFEITTPNVVIGMACMYGGAVQFLCGVWEAVTGNTFGFVALTSYGAFWLSFSTIYLESFGIAAAYEDPQEFSNAVGFFLLAWTMFTLMLVLTTMKSTLAFLSLFFFLFITFFFLTLAAFLGDNKWDRVGGIFVVLTAIIAWYNAWAGTATKQNTYLTSMVIPLTRK